MLVMLISAAAAVKVNNDQLVLTQTQTKRGGFKLPLTPLCPENINSHKLVQDTVRLADGEIDFDLFNLYNSCYLADLYIGTPP